MQGLTSNSSIVGYGKIRWTVRDDNGRKHVTTTHALHIPEAKLRLMSPQVYVNEHGESFHILKNKYYFEFPNGGQQTFDTFSGYEERESCPLHS